MQTSISFASAFKVAVAFAVTGVTLYFFYTISNIVFMFLTAFIFAIAIDRPLDKLVSRGIPRPVAAGVIYAVFLIAVLGALYVIVPTLAQETRNLAVQLPSYLASVGEGRNIDLVSVEEQSLGALGAIRTFSDVLASGSQTIIGTILKISGGLVTFLVVFFVALFLNIEHEGVQRLITLFVPKPHRAYASDLLWRIQSRVGFWLWAKFLSSVFVSIVVFFGLLMIGIEYALTFSILAFFLNFIPFAGPAIAAILPAALGFFISPLHGIAVILLFFLANNIEGFLFLPLIMKRSIQLNPALLIFAVLVGASMAGVLGIIISIPMAAIITLLYDEYRRGWNQGKGTGENLLNTTEI